MRVAASVRDGRNGSGTHQRGRRQSSERALEFVVRVQTQDKGVEPMVNSTRLCFARVDGRGAELSLQRERALLSGTFTPQVGRGGIAGTVQLCWRVANERYDEAGMRATNQVLGAPI